MLHNDVYFAWVYHPGMHTTSIIVIDWSQAFSGFIECFTTTFLRAHSWLNWVQAFSGRRSPAVACWASDHWVASSNPLGGKFRHYFRLIIPGVCSAQFSLNNVHKRGLKHHHFPSYSCKAGAVVQR